MNLASQYYSYCKEIGVMKENYDRSRALQSMKDAVRKVKSVDPEFVKAFDAVTLTSSCTSFRVCMLYKWDIDLDYVVNGNIKHGKISDFGESKNSVYDGLHITKFGDNASYTKLNDFSSINYTIYNDKNLFTYEQMKSALKGVINNQVPRGTTSYESTSWSVSCYAVPVLVVRLDYKGKIYNMCYNLQNGHYHYEWIDDPALIEKGKKARKISGLIRLASIALTVVAFILGATKSFGAAVVPIISFIVECWLWKNKAPSKSYYEKFFVNHPKKGLAAAMRNAIVIAVIAVIALFFGATM